RKLWERANPRTKGVDDDGNLRGAPQTRKDVWQGGFYVKTLCRGCNNDTGATSAAAYVEFVRSLAVAPHLFDAYSGQRVVRVAADTREIARQIAVMVLAIEDIRFCQKHNDLRQFARGELEVVVPPISSIRILGSQCLRGRKRHSVSRSRGHIC